MSLIDSVVTLTAVARPAHLHLKAGKACMQGGWDPLLRIAKSHGVCWVRGKDEDTLSVGRGRSSQYQT